MVFPELNAFQRRAVDQAAQADGWETATHGALPVAEGAPEAIGAVRG